MTIHKVLSSLVFAMLAIGTVLALTILTSCGLVTGETPTVPATETPTALSTKTPTASATETPTALSTKTPPAPATETPTALSTKTPPAPATEIPTVQDDDVIEIIVEPAPFDLYISVVPAAVENRVQISVKASTTLSGTPQAQVYQLGSSALISVALVYESSTGLYTGTADLDPGLSPAGSVAITAQDTTSHTLQIVNNFGLFPVVASEDTVAYSGDGLVELYLPAGSLSGDAYVSFTPDGTVVGVPPEGLTILSDPYTVQASPGVVLNNNAGLTLRYLDTGGTLDGVNLSTAPIYRWDTVAEQWIPLESNVLQDHGEVSTAIGTFGTYAVLTER